MLYLFPRNKHTLHANGTKISITTSYRENSICAIARAAVFIGALERFYTTLYLADFFKVAERLPGDLGRRLSREFGRRSFPGIPHALVESVESGIELTYVFSRRLLGRRGTRFSAKLMYQAADRFDIAVASRLQRYGHVGALVGMSVAASESLRVVKRQGGVGVLNFVNSHPVEHNRYLRELAGLRDSHHEMIPTTVARKVEAELELAELILVPSVFIAAQLASHGVPARKVAMVPYGVDLKAFFPGSGRHCNPGSRHGMLECLFVGQISHRKGVRFLLEAARRCRRLPVRFRLIGPIVSSEVVAELPENVTFDGEMTSGEVGEAMRRADMFVLPTLEDSFALVVFEAMASGLPVVTTSHAGSSETISEGIDGFVVPPCDAGALADAVTHLVEDAALRNRMGSAARSKVMRSYSWETYGREVLNRIHAVKAAKARDICSANLL